ncbi:HVO_2072 family ArtA-dependent S-layer glycoprotein [Halorientalis regularis]|uniref:Cell surface glycoprotein n=1 Tax=Halorientalis regularis TaxID=660518 RepID=A0A1G7LGA3_9EURY|nr:HVO_2072 family ArtA-dependent S-layer glycoprotein [Halorientalis regularis]SDF48557.1 major cell surface glycoprotein [Halorientalis regularis]
MTSTKTKLRSLFLTALMVTSVFAGTVAFAGTATAAANSSSSFSLNPTNVNSDATVTHDYQLNADSVQTDGATDTFKVSLPGSAIFDNAGPNTVNIVNATSGETITPDSVTGVGTSTLTVSLSPGDSTNTQTHNLVISGQITVDFPSPSSPTSVSVGVDYNDAGVSDISRTLTLDIQGPNIDRGAGPGTYDIADSSGTIGDNGQTIFQGEEDIQFASNTVSSYERTGGSAEGEPLVFPVPTDQPTGSYQIGTGGDTVTVQTPRVTTLEVTNQNGDDIAGGAVNVDDQTELTIDAEYNFQNAERLDVTVEDSSGLEVTDEVLENPANDPVRSNNGELTFSLDEDALDNEEYTVTVEGDEDLDFGEATQSVTFDVTTGEEASIEAQADSVTRGENVQFEIGNSAEGETHLVAIEGGDITGDAASVFRNVGDTLDTGTSDDEQAVALVEIDDGVGVGSISTSELDTTDVDITVYAAGVANSGDDLSTIDVAEQNEIDDDSFEVNEGSVTLDNPQGTYVVGSEVTVNGSTAPGIEEVALYARDEGDFEYLDTYNVDGDDTFEEEDVVLSSVNGADVLSIPGTYRIAAVDANDEDVDTDDDGTADATLTSSEVSSAVGQQSSLRVTDTELTVDYVSVINGQVATEDAGTGITINGTAPGQDSVSVSFYGPRGTYDRTTVSVDSDGTFDSESVYVGGNIYDELGFAGIDMGQFGLSEVDEVDTELSQGNVVMSVFSSGRDGQAGDGEFPRNSFPAFAEGLNAQSLTQQQVIDTVASETVEDTGSDDISEVFQFRFTEGRVSVDSVTGEAGQAFTVETNDTMTVSGVTNRQPDDNTITVEVIEGPSSSSFDIESTDVWGTDGQWSVEIPTEGVEPGNYTVEASVGDNSDIRSFQVTGDQLMEPEPEPEPEPTETATPEPEPEPEPTDTMEEPMDTTEEPVETTDAPADTEEQTTTADGPGFTAALALVALVAAALLAVRRRD